LNVLPRVNAYHLFQADSNMVSSTLSFREDKLQTLPIKQLGLRIEGSRLEPLIQEFKSELMQAGLTGVEPRFYLSTEWGTPFGTIAIAIPLYLAWPDLTELHARQTGYVEGASPEHILRYLRHEMGHVINYAYRLYERPQWIAHFGSITQPYLEEYRPEPFSRRFVDHLPGWYAQKHPDEDWAETFAVWMTPGRDWRREYASWSVALEKLRYCQGVMDEIHDREPAVQSAELDEDVGDLTYSLERFYETHGICNGTHPLLDGDLRSIFEDLAQSNAKGEVQRPAAELIRRHERELMLDVFRWTGHFPERTRMLLRHLAERCERFGLTYAASLETTALVALVTMVTTLAMNFGRHGHYVPDAERPAPEAKG
jgi:hypothetical protein